MNLLYRFYKEDGTLMYVVPAQGGESQEWLEEQVAQKHKLYESSYGGTTPKYYDYHYIMRWPLPAVEPKA